MKRINRCRLNSSRGTERRFVILFSGVAHYGEQSATRTSAASLERRGGAKAHLCCKLTASSATQAERAGVRPQVTGCKRCWLVMKAIGYWATVSALLSFAACSNGTQSSPGTTGPGGSDAGGAASSGQSSGSPG